MFYHQPESIMRLLTHNLLVCNHKGCHGGYPLTIQLDEKSEKATVIIPADLNELFIKNMLPKLDWSALVKSASDLGVSLPKSYTSRDLEDSFFLKATHDAIMELHILEGKLVCPDCKHQYNISKGIPNMLLHEDEVNS